MHSFFKSSPLKGHLEKPKTTYLKSTLSLVRSHVSFYHCAWLLVILLFQIFIILVFTTARAPCPPTQQFSPLRLQQQQQQPPEQVTQQQQQQPPLHPDDHQQHQPSHTDDNQVQQPSHPDDDQQEQQQQPELVIQQQQTSHPVDDQQQQQEQQPEQVIQQQQPSHSGDDPQQQPPSHPDDDQQRKQEQQSEQSIQQQQPSHSGDDPQQQPPSHPDDDQQQQLQEQQSEQVIQQQQPSHSDGDQQPQPPSRPDDDQQCNYGKVYVYDLPSMFNKDLLENCHELDPWKSKCPAISNNGFGPKAVTLSRTVPQELAPAWYWTDMFAGDVIFHTRMLSYRCRTVEPESASAFYVPFYAGLAVGNYLFTYYSAKERDWHCEKLVDWIKDQTYWKKSNGSDHFIMLGRTSWDFRRERDENWGSSFLLMPLMKQMLRLSVERNPWDPLDISVPYTTGFHPRSNSDIEQWQTFVRSRERKSLFTFVGATRKKIKNDFRALLLDHCYNESDSCTVVDCSKTKCSDGTTEIFEAFLGSNFCLQPRGDTHTRRSTFDCILAGSIPVFFWQRSIRGQYELFLSSEPESFSVFIDRKSVRNGTSVRRVLEGYSEEDVKSMREKLINFIPRFLYALPSEGLGNNTKDAFDIAVEEVLRRTVNKSI